jgi:hypothetical protein
VDDIAVLSEQMPNGTESLHITTKAGGDATAAESA